MAANYETAPLQNNADRIFEVYVRVYSQRLGHSFPTPAPELAETSEAHWRSLDASPEYAPADCDLRFVQNRVDTDISGL